ncbi:type IV toxin-antitoxin system AbiEi family antitoxin domain-containing protein [Paludibaculum fermentans]|uniref:Type IV toxin-antitoxin system AbiEi family antitoxin n=1 Tax=Paludibaculum fermentans TaxID=1473598 RepID=A0A7S7SQ32_PALFE|nr:type IV toxin-antitoxin system AbiEi family antitoxin domain-containing protein [Paludibaculum fermentans]QOY91795.1 type IV toxin-antitoxin system AbiEi family antitoxin [Paludibaculum fermentans]
MGGQNQGKLNWLQHNLPDGLVVDAGWLERHGVSRQLRHKYILNRWLVALGRGVYRRPDLSEEAEPIAWQQLVISLNVLLQVPVSAGGRTALELQGFQRYVAAQGAREAHVFSNAALPGWVSKVPVDARLVFHRATKLFRNGSIPPYSALTGATAPAASAGVTQLVLGHSKWPLTVSTPERAILELLDEVPKRETFHQADVLIEGLRNLSPRRLQGLLVDCRSVQVKRLFFWFAERHRHSWLAKLDRTAVDLGRGKRMVVREGRLDSKYGITVPEELSGGL